MAGEKRPWKDATTPGFRGNMHKPSVTVRGISRAKSGPDKGKVVDYHGSLMRAVRARSHTSPKFCGEPRGLDPGYFSAMYAFGSPAEATASEPPQCHAETGLLIVNHCSLWTKAELQSRVPSRSGGPRLPLFSVRRAPSRPGSVSSYSNQPNQAADSGGLDRWCRQLF